LVRNDWFLLTFIDNIIKKVEKTSFLYVILVSLREDKINSGDVVDQYLMVSSVVIFVENRLQSGFKYTELEKAVGFSLPHIRAVFAKLTGKSLSRYVLERRIANAAFEIAHSNNSILDIATKYCFSNPDSFTRAFRRITGYNPSDFRRQKRPVGRTVLGAGVFGVSVNPGDNFQNSTERIVYMNNNDNDCIRKAIEYITDNYQNSISLSDLAFETHYSPCHLGKFASRYVCACREFPAA
jgi:AraC-like DNA-binding protein